MNERRPWAKEELILAINLYCKTPFGKIHVGNPQIIELAGKLGRSPGSVSYKLANFASLDESIDRRGAANVSKLDREVWREFYNNWEEMAYQSERLMAEKFGREETESVRIEDDVAIEEGKTTESVVKTRVNQWFFRKTILAAYDSTCCITGINIPDLLIASHIVPWSADTKNRLNPRNGLCLNALHDRAFDRGYISVTEDYRVLVSPRLRSGKNIPAESWFLKYENSSIALPNRFLPDPAFLSYHRENIFKAVR